MLVCFDLSFDSKCTSLIIVYNNYDLLPGATRATHGAIFGTLAHASFMVGSIAHHTKDTVLPSQRTPHIDLSGALMTNELGCHLPNRRRTLRSPHLLESHWHIREILGDGSISCAYTLGDYAPKSASETPPSRAARHSPTPTH